MLKFQTPSRCFAHRFVQKSLRLTALPVGVAHLEVAAGPGGVLAGAIGAADLLDLLAQALQGAVNLQVTVAEDVGVVGAEHTVGIGSLLLWLGDEAQVESATRGARGTRGSRRSWRTLYERGRNGLINGIRSIV